MKFITDACKRLHLYTHTRARTHTHTQSHKHQTDVINEQFHYFDTKEKPRQINGYL